MSATPSSALLEYFFGCPICASEDLTHYRRVPSLFNDGEFIQYDKCHGCGVVFRNPRLPAQDREDIYVEKILPESTKRLDPKTQVHYSYLIDALVDLVGDPSGKRILDFGCGNGGFLVEAKKAGFEPYGLELNRDMAEYVQGEHGVEIYQGFATDPEFQAQRFDVIVSTQVFEHLVDPKGTLDSLTNCLNEGGLVYTEVPNLLDTREVVRRGSTMDDSHLYYFNAKALEKMHEACGYKRVKIEQGMRPYRFLRERSTRVSWKTFRGIERVLSGAGIRTALGLFARRA